jgi:hypothetical protein
MTVFRGFGVRSIAIPIVFAVGIALVIRWLVPEHRTGAGLLGVGAIVVGTCAVVATAFWARGLDERRTRLKLLTAITRRDVLGVESIGTQPVEFDVHARALANDDPTAALWFANKLLRGEVGELELSNLEIERLREIKRVAARDPAGYLQACGAGGI